MWTQNIEAESQSLRSLSQRRGRDRSVLNAVEQELLAYQEALVAEAKAQAEVRKREEAAQRRAEEAREKVGRSSCWRCGM